MNVFIGVFIGFLIGVVVVCLVSSFLTRYEEFKTKTEDKLKKVKKDIRTMDGIERDSWMRQVEQNAKFDKRIKQAEEAIATLNRALMAKEKGRHEVDHNG